MPRGPIPLRLAGITPLSEEELPPMTTDAVDAQVVAELWGVHKRYGKVQALRGVDPQRHPVVRRHAPGGRAPRQPPLYRNGRPGPSPLPAPRLNIRAAGTLRPRNGGRSARRRPLRPPEATAGGGRGLT